MKNLKENLATLLVLIGTVLFVVATVLAFIASSITLFYVGIIGMFIMFASVGLTID